MLIAVYSRKLLIFNSFPLDNAAHQYLVTIQTSPDGCCHSERSKSIVWQKWIFYFNNFKYCNFVQI